MGQQIPMEGSPSHLFTGRAWVPGSGRAGVSGYGGGLTTQPEHSPRAAERGHSWRAAALAPSYQA